MFNSKWLGITALRVEEYVEKPAEKISLNTQASDKQRNMADQRMDTIDSSITNRTHKPVTSDTSIQDNAVFENHQKPMLITGN